MKKNKIVWVIVLLIIFIICVFIFSRGDESKGLIGDSISMTRLVNGEKITQNGFISIPFLKNTQEYNFVDIAVDLNKDSVIESYNTLDGKIQEEWLVRNIHPNILSDEANNYSIIIPDKTIENRNDFSVYIIIGKNKINKWSSSDLTKEAKINKIEHTDYSPYYSPDPEGLRVGGFFNTKYALAQEPDYLIPLASYTDNDTSTFAAFRSGVPDLNQEHNECAPTSVANSFIWLSKQYNFPNKIPPESTVLISEFKQDMNWDKNGVLIEDLFSGIDSFIDRHNIPVEAYQVGDVFGTDIVSQISYAIDQGDDVEAVLDYGIFQADGSYVRKGGHVVTVVGAWSVNGMKYLGFHDPLSRGPGILDMYRINGTQVINYAFQEADMVTNIRFVAAETKGEDVVIKKTNYDGTYSGTFNYEYQDVNRFNSEEIITPWKAGSFNITMTLKTLNDITPNDSDPYFFLDAYNVVISDPEFNTGSGVDAVDSFGGQISVRLPVDPNKQDSKNSSIYLNIPSSDYSSRYLEITDGAIQVNPDGKTISLDPNFDSANKNKKPWKAETSSLCSESIFCKAGSYKNIVFDRHFRYGSWSLTKVSD